MQGVPRHCGGTPLRRYAQLFMPIVKIFIGPGAMPGCPDTTNTLIARVAAHCIATLKANPELVQVIAAPLLAEPHGAGVHVEVNFRISPARSENVLANFMDAIDNDVRALLQVQPRIRCFAEVSRTLFAKN